MIVEQSKAQRTAQCACRYLSGFCELDYQFVHAVGAGEGVEHNRPRRTPSTPMRHPFEQKWRGPNDRAYRQPRQLSIGTVLRSAPNRFHPVVEPPYKRREEEGRIRQLIDGLQRGLAYITTPIEHERWRMSRF